MLPELLEQWGRLAQTSLETVKELSELNTRYVEQAAQQQLALATASLDAAVKGTQLVSEAKGYKQLITGQTALANEYGERLLKIARKSNEVAAEAREEYGTWLEGKVREAAAPIVRVANPSAAKKAG